MGLTKLIIGLIVLGCIVILGNEWRKKRAEEKANEDLHEELETVQMDIRKTDASEDVLDAKITLKTREQELAEKAKQLLDPDAYPAGKREVPTPPPGREIKEGEQPPKPAAKKAAPKKKVAKKKAAPKKKAPAKKK